MRVFEKNYLPPMCAIFRAIRPRRQLVIGPLLGTTESYSIKKTGHHPELIVLCDVDHGSCNWLRNNLAYCYTNLTGPRTGDYHGNLVVIRADSRHIAEELIALGPYDLIFVDGEHTKDALVNDLDICHKSLAAKGVVLVHDIEAATHPVGECYLEWLDAHPEYSHVEISKDIFQNGLGVVWRTEDYLKE